MSDVIYKSNSCPGCVTIENALRANPIPEVRFLNIDTDPQARLYFEMTGSRSVPTAVIGGQAYIGASQIISALRARYGKP